MLDEARLRHLYTQVFRPADGSPEWLARYEAFIQRIKQLPDDELRSPSVQAELWRARAITGLGPGESVDVKSAYTDHDIVESLVALRTQSWPADDHKRAAAIQAEYDRLLELMIDRGHSSRRPQARLARVFAALLPGELHCVYQYSALRNVRDLLLTGKHPDGVIAEHVLARATLRRALGPENSVADNVRRSMFCWWLHKQHDALLAGQEPDFDGEVGAAGNDLEPLALWPFNKQSKGLPAFARLSDAFKDVVRKTLAGVERQELVESLGSETDFTHLAPSSRGVLVTNLKSVGLVELRDGLLFPSKEGEEFLESDEPDALVELLLVKYFPFAHLLRLLHGGPLASNELYTGLQSIYPQWKSTLGPSQALAWVKDLGLVESSEGRNSLTPYGAAWHQRLPQDLPKPSPKEKSRSEDAVAVAVQELSPEEAAKKAPDLESMLRSFREDPDAKKLFFTTEQITALHAAWHCLPGKHFVILSGLSGTGKTAIVRHYARLYLRAMGLDPAQHTELVAVSPDWRDPSGLLGYVNPLQEEPTYQASHAVQLLVRASQSPHLPFFLVLDEMNLASVERYFAPLLSAMETQDEIKLHSAATELNGIPPAVRWPAKLFIAGTVNMDETTHSISDKVLDRAFTLEFWDVDLQRHFERREQHDTRVEKLLVELNELLRPVRRHFGYRTANEVLAFAAGAGDAQTLMLDQAVYSKVLPRLRGEETPELKKALDAALACCKSEGLTRSAEKLASMKLQLETTGLTRFWS